MGNVQYIDCLYFIKLSQVMCLSDDPYFHLQQDSNKSLHYKLMIQNKTQMKMVEEKEESMDEGIELFDGRLKGVPISAAIDFDDYGRQLVYFFAGRHLCRQEIHPTNWTKMCDIEDISD